MIKGHNKTCKGLLPPPPVLFFLQECLKNVERFPGDTNEKLLEMWGGTEPEFC